METSREIIDYKNIKETTIQRISWPAILAGTLVMLITLMLLSLLGVGIGLGSINPAEEVRPMQGIGTGTLIWWVVSNLIAVFAGAYTAANLTNATYKFSGIYHGVLTWSLFTLISFWLMSTAIGGIVSAAGGAVSKSLSAAGLGVSGISSMADTESIKRSIQDALNQDQKAGDANRKQFDIDVMAVVQDVFIANGQIKTDVNRQEIEQSVAKHSTLSREDAARATDVIMGKYQQAKQQWQEVVKPKLLRGAQQAADTASKAAIWTFVALVLGLITAAVGGKTGEPDLVSTEERPQDKRYYSKSA